MALIGCATVTPNQVQTTVNVLNATVPVAVAYAIQKDTNTVPYIRASADVIEVVASGTNLAPAVLIADLNKIPQFNSPEAKLAVMAGVGIYSAFYGQTLGNDTNTVLILKTLSADIRLGLGEQALAKIKRKK